MSELLLTSEPVSDVGTATITPLLLDGLIEFQNRKWDIQPHRVRYSEEGSTVPAIDTVYFTNHKGKIVHPKVSPYIPVSFTSTPTESPARLGRQWLAVSKLMAEDMRDRGLAGGVPLAPEVTDARSWFWADFYTEVRYTYRHDFPFDETLPDSAVRRQIAKARKNGFRTERVTRMEDVFECLSASANRKEFNTDVDAHDLYLLRDLVGDDHLRVYVGYSPEGEPACGGVMLHRSGGRALYWVFGTKSKYLQTGVTQSTIRYIFDDLERAGATGIDFLGAMLPGVAAMKASWGATLVPYFRVDGGRLRSIPEFLHNHFHFVAPERADDIRRLYRRIAHRQ